MKLTKIELADFSAAARMFPSKVITAGLSKTSDGVRIEDLNMDDNGHVWMNKGRWVLPASSLAYWVPENAEAEWTARFQGWAEVPEPAKELTRAPIPGEFKDPISGLIKDETSGLVAMAPCTQCGKCCASPAGLAAHMRSHREGG